MAISAIPGSPETEEKRGTTDLNHLPKKDLICVVVALYDEVQREKEAVIQVTKDPQEAVETTRDAEKLGYQFCSDGTGASVYFLEVGKQYHKALFDLPDEGKQLINYPIIFRRYKMNGEWQEEWFDEMMKFMMGLR